MSRPFQFSLKALFALTILVAIWCVHWRYRSSPADLVAAYLVFILTWLGVGMLRVYVGLRKGIKEARAQGRELTPMEWKKMYENVCWSVIETTPFMRMKRPPPQEKSEGD